MPKKLHKQQLKINDQVVLVKIYEESRNSVRFSIGKTAAIMRMPINLSKEDKSKYVAKFETWLKTKFASNERLQTRFEAKQYASGDTITVGDRTYVLQLEQTKHKTHSAVLKDGVIYFKLADEGHPPTQAIKTLLSRLIAKDFHPEISQRIHELNDKYFQKPIHSIRLKYNHSNWGSCSTKGNVNLSTRLLFAPKPVQDYVFIHELAHLIEMNHSPRFWKIVADIMPSYKEKEQWLKKNGHLCDF